LREEYQSAFAQLRFFVDILQILLSTPRFSKVTPLRRSIGYPQMRYREDAKDAKLREEENKI
jgi:hypothetical protein